MLVFFVLFISRRHCPRNAMPAAYAAASEKEAFAMPHELQTLAHARHGAIIFSRRD